MSWHVSPWVYHVWDSLFFLQLGYYFFSYIREVFDYNLFKYFFQALFFSLLLLEPLNVNLGAFNIVPEVSETVLIYFHSFFFILLHDSDFHYSVFQITYSFLCLSYSAIDFLWCIFRFIYCVAHLCFFFRFSIRLLYISFIFSICAIILFLRYWVIFTVITLNYFSGRLPICSSFSCSCRFLSCSFFCNIILCLLILSNLLCLWTPFCRLQNHIFSCFWCLPPGGWGWSKDLCRLWM